MGKKDVGLILAEEENVATSSKKLFGGKATGRNRMGRRYVPRLILANILGALPLNGRPLTLKELCQKVGHERLSRHVIRRYLEALQLLENKMLQIYTVDNTLLVRLVSLEQRYVVPNVAAEHDPTSTELIESN